MKLEKSAVLHTLNTAGLQFNADDYLGRVLESDCRMVNDLLSFVSRSYQ